MAKETILTEQNSEYVGEHKRVKLELDEVMEGKIWIKLEGYGDPSSQDGEGCPVGIEIWEGQLRLIVWDDINVQDPRIINMEGANELAREE